VRIVGQFEFAARAIPPLDAPSLDSATAAGFRVSGGSTRFGIKV
jgi:hypothetical protein